MKKDEDLEKKYLLKEEEETGEGASGSSEGGGEGGGVSEVVFRFRDTLTSRRDDLLPPHEIKRLLAVETDIHKAIVDKQKLLIKERKAQKEGKTYLKSYEKGGFGMGYDTSNYKTHPISLKAQFSGATDKKMAAFPNLNESNTNEGDQNKLENKYENKLRHQYAPGKSITPKLTRY